LPDNIPTWGHLDYAVIELVGNQNIAVAVELGSPIPCSDGDHPASNREHRCKHARSASERTDPHTHAM
jgi:hypothetical protein